MMAKHARIAGFPLLVGLLAMVSCSPPRPSLTPVPPPVVTVARPIVVPMLTRYDEYPGTIQAMYTIDIQARVDGYITAINFRDGEEIPNERLKLTDPLFVIDPRTYQSQYDLAVAQAQSYEAQVKFQKIEVARNEALLKSGGASSREELERSIAKRDQAIAGLAEAKASMAERLLYLDWTKVRSPRPGKLSRRQVDVGNLVSGNATSGTLLTTLVSVDPMYVYFDVDERSVQRYRQLVRDGKMGIRKADSQHIEDAKLPVYVGLTSEKGFPHVGIIDFVDNTVNPATGTLQVRGVIPNPDRVLQPGYFARVQVQGGETPNAIVISERCIGTQQSTRFVLIVGADGKVESRIVELGRVADGMRVIESGLNGDERILTEGLLRVLPGDEVEVKEGKMPTTPEWGAPRPSIPKMEIPKPTPNTPRNSSS